MEALLFLSATLPVQLQQIGPEKYHTAAGAIESAQLAIILDPNATIWDVVPGAATMIKDRTHNPNGYSPTLDFTNSK